MRFEYQRRESWPPLAWIAAMRPGEPRIEIIHGPAVETHSEWFCECVWDARFAEGGFDQTDIVAGTGGRIRDGSLCLVSSGSTVDRLQFTEHNGSIWVSNSIVCLMAMLEGHFDPSYPRYLRDFTSIVRGIHHYVRTLPSDLGPVSLVYFDNLRWNGQELRVEPKPEPHRDFSTFESYHDFLKSSLERIGSNMRDEEREHRYEFQGTLSTGYDSTTITTLAKPFGLGEVLCFEYPSGRDRGAYIASYLGVKATALTVDAWREGRRPELPFLSVNGFGEEVHFSSADSHLASRVLLTGFHGDKVWDRNNPYLSPEIVRGDLSGLALSEYRLWRQFFNCAVPFWGSRHVNEINRISRDPSMKPWDVEGDYTRPICRRIVEGAGVPREAFGVTKSFASRWYVLEPDNLTPESESDFFQYLAGHRRDWWRKLRFPPSSNRARDNARLGALQSLASVLVTTPGWYRLRLHRWPILGGLTALRTPNPPFTPAVIGARRYYFPWAVERCKKRYLADRS